MRWPAGLRMIGLTGGIASGKSTVAGMLREHGARIIDADELARQVVAPGTVGLRQVAERFGDVLAPDGTLDRARLGARVFSDPNERQALGALLHPLIHQAALAQAEALAEEGARTVLYDAALLIENGLQHAMEGVILVAAPQALQLARLQQRNGLSEEAARARIASQLPLEEKRRWATWVVENQGSLEETRRQVARIWESINERQA